MEPPHIDVECPTWKQLSCIEIDHGFCCENCYYKINKQINQIERKALEQYKRFSKRLPFAEKKDRRKLFVYDECKVQNNRK